MNVIDCEQGSREWVEARLGIPTASQFSRLLTPKRMQVSASRHRYRAELLAEWITGEPVDEFETEWTRADGGKAMEPLAREPLRGRVGRRLRSKSGCAHAASSPWFLSETEICRWI